MKSLDYFQMIKLILFSILIELANGFPDGAPNSVCMSMMPQHDVASKECQLKYVIQSDKSEYSPGDIIRSRI